MSRRLEVDDCFLWELRRTEPVCCHWGQGFDKRRRWKTDDGRHLESGSTDRLMFLTMADWGYLQFFAVSPRRADQDLGGLFLA